MSITSDTQAAFGSWLKRRRQSLNLTQNALAERLVGDSYSQIILNQLEQANLFLLPLDDQRQWYRYHHLFSDGDFLAAERVLHTAYSDERQFRDSAIFGSAGLLLAYAYLRSERTADALAILDAVLSLHEQDDTPGLVVLTGAPIIVPLLHLALAHDLHAPFAARTLRLLPQLPLAPSERVHSQPRRARATADLLTVRELDVLRQIALGASNDEIAKRLIISLATVKKHINNIFAKLYAQSRIQALVHARERGILEQP